MTIKKPQPLFCGSPRVIDAQTASLYVNLATPKIKVIACADGHGLGEDGYLDDFYFVYDPSIERKESQVISYQSPVGHITS